MRPDYCQRSRDQSRHCLIRWSTSRNVSRSIPDDAGTARAHGRAVTTRICATNNRRASAKRGTHCSALPGWHESLEPIQRTFLPFWRNRSCRNDRTAVRTRRTARLLRKALVCQSVLFISSIRSVWCVWLHGCFRCSHHCLGEQRGAKAASANEGLCPNSSRTTCRASNQAGSRRNHTFKDEIVRVSEEEPACRMGKQMASRTPLPYRTGRLDTGQDRKFVYENKTERAGSGVRGTACGHAVPMKQAPSNRPCLYFSVRRRHVVLVHRRSPRSHPLSLLLLRTTFQEVVHGQRIEPQLGFHRFVLG